MSTSTFYAVRKCKRSYFYIKFSVFKYCVFFLSNLVISQQSSNSWIQEMMKPACPYAISTQEADNTLLFVFWLIILVWTSLCTLQLYVYFFLQEKRKKNLLANIRTIGHFKLIASEFIIKINVSSYTIQTHSQFMKFVTNYFTIKVFKTRSWELNNWWNL